MLRRAAAALAICTTAFAFAACGEDDEGRVDVEGSTTGATTAAKTAPAPAGPPVARVGVAESEYAIQPKVAKVPKTGTVTFEVVNRGKIDHALEIEGPDGEVETEAIKPGGRATLKANFKRAGNFKWYCPIADHEQRGMTGEVEVAGGGEAGADGHGGY